VSTEDLESKTSEPFCFLMDASMLGVGVGFDTKGAGTLLVKGADYSVEPVKYVIPDSREGWVQSLKMTLDAHFDGSAIPEFDFSQIRKAGEPIKGFGGISSGPIALQHLIEDVTQVLENHRGRHLSVTGIVDIMNYIGKCVVAGNVRRTAEIAFGDPSLPEYLDLKDYSKNPSRVSFGWTSNNSVFAELGMNYSAVCERIKNNGEPGLAWLDNMREFSRMSDAPDYKDFRAGGGNPCLEQTLESYELCCLVETFPEKHESLEDYLETLRYAFLYAKTVTLGSTHWSQSNAVMLRNRRIGCSMSGIAQFITNRGLHELRKWSREGYSFIEDLDRQYSEWLCIPQSIKRTSIKPSGTVSLLAGATPGMHYPESRFYIRRVRLSKNSDLVAPLQKAGYFIEDAVGQPDTVVVEIPVDCGAGIRTLKDVSIWEQVSLAAFLQEHWSDNQVSCTVTFDPESESKDLENVLNYFQYKLKGISFLPKLAHGAYPQMPYESITEEQYLNKIVSVSPCYLVLLNPLKVKY
jgi:ribonucleoside-triphosphate reductase (thioredoxin)